MHSHEPSSLPVSLRFLRMFFLLELVPVLVLLLNDHEAAAAPITSCDSFVYTCPEVDSNGYALMDSPYAISPEGSYSIFDCVYGIPNTQTDRHTCHYYKVSGEIALGPDRSPCPRQAPTCLAAGAPRFSVPEKLEKVTWIESGKYSLWMKENHT